MQDWKKKQMNLLVWKKKKKEKKNDQPVSYTLQLVVFFLDVLCHLIDF